MPPPPTTHTTAQALYFTIVTLSTVGYGDVIPAADLSRALSMVIILIFLFALPFQVPRLDHSTAHSAATPPPVPL